MDFFVRKQYETADRNKLDAEIREYAAKKMEHLYVKDEYVDVLVKELKNKVSELNAKYSRVSKKLDVGLRKSEKDVIYISFSECLSYVAYRVKNVYSPF
jgi:tRNA(Phe) wybutosine-synthesizing methylase Tyw3